MKKIFIIILLLVASVTEGSVNYSKISYANAELDIAMTTYKDLANSEEQYYRSNAGEKEYYYAMTIAEDSQIKLNKIIKTGITPKEKKVLLIRKNILKSYNTIKELLFLDEILFKDYRQERIFSKAYYHQLRSIVLLKESLTKK